MIDKMKIFFFFFPAEGYIWSAALFILAVLNVESAHFTICPFNNLGLDFCPGCGLGKSIHYFVHLDFMKSFYTHPLGGAAFIILLYRIFSLAKRCFSISKLSHQKGA